ncbi:asialoglycoprotein receptor 1-like isoform X2 [Pseudophryne corroboree]|uniref:asialoglycoprotein receptor 1-like isoform X2 n=1 Tax=Pseudophryne corroboree TaxID=495146 RepID=UPI003081FBE8
MSLEYQEFQNVREDAAPGSSAGFSLWRKPGLAMSRGVSLPPYLICALSVVCAALIIIIILVVALTNNGVNRTEQSFESKLGNLSASLNSIVVRLSQDGAVMKEKLKDIEATIKDRSKDTTMMSKLTEISASVARILSDEVTGSFQSDIQRILDAVGKMREEMRKENGTQDPLCSIDWSHYAMSCYYLSRRIRTWDGAKKDCEDKKAHLVVITSAEEQEFIGRMTRDIRTWIGLTDQDGSWKWVDGTSYDSSPKFWRSDQPDNWFGHGLGGGEDCAQFWSYDDTNYSWNDDHCSRRFLYICEMKI